MTKFRLNALKRFERKPMLEWFAKNMPDIDFDDIYYYLKPTDGQVVRLGHAPREMKNTYEKLGIPEAERKFLAGVTAQYESEVVYHKNREDLEEQGDPVHRHGHRAARVPRARPAVLRHGHPAGRQQVRRAQLGGVGRAARSSTCRRACTSTCRCRRTSASTRRTPASSSAR